MRDYIILLRDILLQEGYVALQWTGEGSNEDDAYKRFVEGSATFDPDVEKRDDFLVLQVTRDERIAVEQWDDRNGPQSEYPLRSRSE